MTRTVSPARWKIAPVLRLPIVILMLAVGMVALGSGSASASNAASAQLGEIDGVYTGFVSMGVAQPNYAVPNSHVEVVISGGSNAEILLEFTLQAGLRYEDDVLVCTATIQSRYRGTGSVASGAIETILTLESYQVLSAEGSTCGVSEPSWSTTIEQDLAAEFAADDSFVFIGTVTDGVVTGSFAEGVFLASATKDPFATPTDGTGSDEDESGATKESESDNATSATDEIQEGFLPGSPDEDGGGVPPAVIIGLVIAGGGAAAGLVRSGTINLGPRGPGPEETIGYGGTPGSAAVIIDMLERTAMRRSHVIKTWRAEGIDGLDRLARWKEVEGVATKNPMMATVARQALTTMWNPDFAGLAHPPPPEAPPPPSP